MLVHWDHLHVHFLIFNFHSSSLCSVASLMLFYCCCCVCYISALPVYVYAILL